LVDKSEFLALMTPEALALLDQIEYGEKADVVALVSRLRAAGHDASAVAAVLSQAKLRRRANNKFGEFADRMLFTEAGLEQATRLSVAALHAGRFASAGLNRVADLGCGIGTESIAMASLGISVDAYEIDEVTAAVASFNLAGFDSVKVINDDASGANLDSYDALWFDPARRELGGPRREQTKRKFNPADYSPNYDWVLQQAAKKPTGVKLGPGHPHEAIPTEAEAQWVSVAGDLVECTLWFGTVARSDVSRSALLLTDSSKHEFVSDSFEATKAPLGSLSAFVYEPDNAIIRSHLIGELAQTLGAHAFAPEIAYLTSDNQIDSPWLKSYRVVDEMAFDRKKLKAYLRENNIGILEIKKRGSDVVPEVLRKEMQLKGENAATLIITRVGDAHRVLVTEAVR